MYVHVVEKFCLFLEFMLSPETELEWNDDSQTVISMQVLFHSSITVKPHCFSLPSASCFNGDVIV